MNPKQELKQTTPIVAEVRRGPRTSSRWTNEEFVHRSRRTREHCILNNPRPNRRPSKYDNLANVSREIPAKLSKEIDTSDETLGGGGGGNIAYASDFQDTMPDVLRR